MIKSQHHRFFLLAGILVIVVAMFFALRVQGASFLQPSDVSLINQLEKETAGDVRIAYHRETEQVRFIGTTLENPVSMNKAVRSDSSPESISGAFLNEYGLLFGLQDPEQELMLKAEQALD